MGSDLLAVFEPLYPAVTFRCQLCGTTIAEDELITASARVQRDRVEAGEFCFCVTCAPKIDEITRKLLAEADRLDSNHERSRSERLRALAAQFAEELRQQHQGTGAEQPAASSAPKAVTPPARNARPPRPLSIPQP